MKLSIITVCLNNRDGLQKTINSVADQSFGGFEFIVIDGASNDGSLELIKQREESIDKWISEKDKGVYQAMNKGINMAAGDYCLFLNSGDTLATADVLNKVFNADLDEDIIYGNLIRKKGNKHYRINKYPDHLTLYHFYAEVPSIHHQASFIKRDLFKKYGLYREDLRIISDWEFFLKAIILNNCSTRHLSWNISIFDSSGMSSGARNSEAELKRKILSGYFPDRVLENLEILMKRKKSGWPKIKEYLKQNHIIYFLARMAYLPFAKAREYLKYQQISK